MGKWRDAIRTVGEIEEKRLGRKKISITDKKRE